MMIESSFLCSSPWGSDIFQDFDAIADVSSLIDFEAYSCSLERESSKFSSCPTTPNDLSSNSSDYEGFVIDDLENILPISDTFVSQILEEDNAIGFNDLDWPPLSESPKKNLTSVDSLAIPRRNSKKTNSSVENLLSSKTWSKMSQEEQLQTLHDLSEIVTCHMGIREQIEVIKIIDPSAIISPDDTEFALDCDILTDVKLKKIKDFLRKQRFHIRESAKNFAQSTHVASVKNSDPSKVLSRKASNSSYSRTKRRQKKEKTCPDNKRIQRKLQRQGRKEEQSGLFVYEKMIKKHNNPLEEDEDVNILE